MKRLGYVVSAAALLILAEATAFGAADADKAETPIGRVLGVRGSATELTTYNCADRNPAGTTRAELLRDADILEDHASMLKVRLRSGGQVICLDRRELVTTLSRSNAQLCDPVKAQSKLAQDLRSQGLGNSGCK